MKAGKQLFDIGGHWLLELLVGVGEAHGASAAEIALAWLLRRPAVTSVAIGAKNEARNLAPTSRRGMCG